MIRSILHECGEIVKELVGHEYLYLDTAVEIKLTPHMPPVRIWGVSLSPAGDLFVMDQEECWHKPDLNDNHSALLIGSLYQRLKLMRIRYAKAS